MWSPEFSPGDVASSRRFRQGITWTWILWTWNEISHKIPRSIENSGTTWIKPVSCRVSLQTDNEIPWLTLLSSLASMPFLSSVKNCIFSERGKKWNERTMEASSLCVSDAQLRLSRSGLENLLYTVNFHVHPAFWHLALKYNNLPYLFILGFGTDIPSLQLCGMWTTAYLSFFEPSSHFNQHPRTFFRISWLFVCPRSRHFFLRSVHSD